ncbi:phage virion morphogenesis protein [Tabrizicola flagellatus]|uniref:phage virion morphogenesis protein n=1 Tax=Tabrizicola flagellatus TaxID=2593021 RepID=UPI0011F264A2|nr:phage virion morphogenesis protein [Tabrizicola flagellatus]
MATVEIKDDEITAALARLSAALSDLTPVFQGIGEIVVNSTRQRFAQGVAPDGGRWAPKSRTTLLKYSVRSSNRIDVRPLFGRSGALSSQIFYEAGPDSLQWGSPRIYAATQQFGARQGAFGRTSRNGPIPWGDIPARPFLGLSVEDEANILKALGDWLERAAAS